LFRKKTKDEIVTQPTMKQLLKLILLPIILVILTNCSSPKTTEIQDEKQVFKNYLTQIPTLKLPLKFQCINFDYSTVNKINELEVSKFGPENSRVLGKLKLKNNLYGVIYIFPADAPLPILQINNEYGKKISKLNFYENYCGEDENYFGSSSAIINKDLSIELKDSAVFFKRDSKGQILEKTKKIENRKRRFEISNSGKIVVKTN
jgi:hypothetical protein